MNQTIDIYCERLGSEFWAEPLNAISNIAFFIAAFAAFRLARKQNRFNIGIVTLITFLTIIGAGSSLFHTLATYWAMLADSLPILLYQIAFLIFYARDIIKLSAPKIAILLVLFFSSIAVFAQMPSSWLNGSLGYAPALIFLIGFGIWHYGHAKNERLTLISAAAIFALSLSARSMDMAVCETLPIGVHYFWHILNGFVLYLTIRAYILGSNVKS